MLYVKIMHGQDRPDTDPWHTYQIVTVRDDQAMEFRANTVPDGQEGNKEGERFSLAVRDKDGSLYLHYLTGNAYVMNESGKTIASHGC
jgi:hypothetical protein